MKQSCHGYFDINGVYATMSFGQFPFITAFTTTYSTTRRGVGKLAYVCSFILSALVFLETLNVDKSKHSCGAFE